MTWDDLDADISDLFSDVRDEYGSSFQRTFRVHVPDAALRRLIVATAATRSQWTASELAAAVSSSAVWYVGRVLRAEGWSAYKRGARHTQALIYSRAAIAKKRPGPTPTGRKSHVAPNTIADILAVATKREQWWLSEIVHATKRSKRAVGIALKAAGWISRRREKAGSWDVVYRLGAEPTSRQGLKSNSGEVAEALRWVRAGGWRVADVAAAFGVSKLYLYKLWRRSDI